VLQYLQAGQKFLTLLFIYIIPGTADCLAFGLVGCEYYPFFFLFVSDAVLSACVLVWVWVYIGDIIAG
jgi:hypothetical protein